MIHFSRLALHQKEAYDRYLQCSDRESCEYAFANLYLWGRQKASFGEDFVILFSHFGRSSVYPFPVGCGDPAPALDAIMADAAKRGIACRLTSLSAADCEYLQQHYPGKFRFHLDRDHFDYVYSIQDLADLAGRKFQKKRNHMNRFCQAHPDFTVAPLTQENRAAAEEMVANWYENRVHLDPHGDYVLEKTAMQRAFSHLQELQMEGLLLMDGDEVLAVTMGSRMKPDTFDIHFEKAREDVDGAYTAINREFARYLRNKYPDVQYLNREDDMGLPGLRKAKESYNPHHLVEKYWARLWEEEDED